MKNHNQIIPSFALFSSSSLTTVLFASSVFFLSLSSSSLMAVVLKPSLGETSVPSFSESLPLSSLPELSASPSLPSVNTAILPHPSSGVEMSAFQKRDTSETSSQSSDSSLDRPIPSPEVKEEMRETY